MAKIRNLPVNDDVFQQWINHPTTRHFMRVLTAALEEERRRMGQGRTIDMDKPELTHGKCADAAGYCRAVEQALAIKPEPVRKKKRVGAKPEGGADSSLSGY